MLKHLETESRTWTTKVATQGIGAATERTAEDNISLRANAARREPMKMPDL